MLVELYANCAGMPLDGQPRYDLELDEAVKVTTHRPRLAAKHNPEKRYGRGNDLYGSQPGNHGKVSQDRDLLRFWPAP